MRCIQVWWFSRMVIYVRHSFEKIWWCVRQYLSCHKSIIKLKLYYIFKLSQFYLKSIFEIINVQNFILNGHLLPSHKPLSVSQFAQFLLVLTTLLEPKIYWGFPNFCEVFDKPFTPTLKTKLSSMNSNLDFQGVNHQQLWN